MRDLKKETLQPGKHSYPFSIDLPSSLPSSSIYRVGSGEVGFSIRYKLTARLGLWTKTIPVAVAAKALELGSSPFTLQPTDHAITSVNGSKQGFITVAAHVDATNIPKGERLTISLSCRNNSLVKIQRVELKLVELRNWGPKKGYNKSRLFKDALVKTGDIDLPSLERKNGKSFQIVDTTYRTVEEQNAMHSTMHQDIISGQNSVDLICPFRARDSYSGTLVDIRHYLKIKFITNSFGTQPSVKVPLKVGLPIEIPNRNQLSIKGMDETNKVTLMVSESDINLPIASAVAPLSPSGYDEYERALEPHPPKKELCLDDCVAQGGETAVDFEVDIGGLVPMLPPRNA